MARGIVEQAQLEFGAQRDSMAQLSAALVQEAALVRQQLEAASAAIEGLDAHMAATRAALDQVCQGARSEFASVRDSEAQTRQAVVELRAHSQSLGQAVAALQGQAAGQRAELAERRQAPAPKRENASTIGASPAYGQAPRGPRNWEHDRPAALGS